MRIGTISRDERGAVLAVVALSLIALMGMVVLVVDVGGLLVMKRRLVTTADAAALAAAQECAQNNGVTAATTQANVVASGNIDGTVGKLSFSTNCAGAASGVVTARYRANQQLFFAPLLGLGENMAVSAPAQAIWGPARAVRSTPPINLHAGAGGSTFPCAFDPAHPCNFWTDNASSPFDPNDSWSFLGLESPEWPASIAENVRNRTCPNNTFSNIGEYAAGRSTRLVEIPTYVCALSGRGGSAEQSQQFQALEKMEGKIFQFPVSDPARNVTTIGREKFAVIGFVALKVIDVIAGTGGSSGQCGAVPFTFTKTPRIDAFPATALFDLCAASAPSGAVFTPNISHLPGRNLVPTTDFIWNPTTKTITEFNDFAKPDGITPVEIYFTWTTPGPCAPPPGVPQPNSFCIVTEWVDNQFGGTDPDPTAPDFGTRAIRLSQ